MQNYVIGMDGGGTKTEVYVTDRDKNILLHFMGGAINYNGGSKVFIDSNLQTILQRIKDEGYSPEACSGICIGAAGTSNPIVNNQIKENVLTFGYICPISILGDVETAFAGALENKPGFILIAGTGSICYGRDVNGKVYRTGGFGHIIGDEGSGYAIARDILTAVARAQDGRGEPTLLTDMVYQYLKIRSIEEMIGYIYHPGRSKKEIAELSVLIQEAYALRDKAATRIVKKCVSDLMDLVTPLLTNVEESPSLTVSGSILLKNGDIFKEFVNQMNEVFPNTEIIKPRHDAAYGAVLLALQL
jgi:N-acetylglucosamine kinase-like BadF-type ATPase